ncbi:MAG: hypothetical protein FJ096_17425 [Deltaproteobacteria bacterium]|nr:hypothetical protein [Deltaproteobacteria bacterium]
MIHWKKACAPLLLLGLAPPLLLNCAALNKVADVAGVGCPAAQAMETGDFSGVQLAGDAKGELKGFLSAVYDTKKLSVETESGLIAACAELGTAIGGIDEAALKAEPSNGDGAKKVCNTVTDRVKAMIAEAGNAKLVVTVTEPKCNVDIDEMLDCYDKCGSPVQPGDIEASCVGGEISGQCDAECKGSCSVEASASCSGTCDGNCTGKCDGKDMKEGAICAGKCEGKCDASCKMAAQGKCEGTCSGSCSVKAKAPQCTGTFRPPSVNLSCQIDCGSKSLKMIKCRPPRVKVSTEGKSKIDLNKLVKALEASMPKIAEIELGLGKRAKEQAEALITYSAKMPELAEAGGTQGIACIATATDQGKQALGSITATVDVSVSVKASMVGSASTGG